MSKNFGSRSTTLADSNSDAFRKMFWLRTNRPQVYTFFAHQKSKELKQQLSSGQLPYPVVVEDIGVEPMTLCVQGRCSSQLS